MGLDQEPPSRVSRDMQPKSTVWGYRQNESKPEVMAQKIAAAADYGVNAFSFRLVLL